MRRFFLAAALTLASCVSPPVQVTTSTLAAADAATSLSVGERVTREISTQSPEHDGMDPVVSLALRHSDGRVMHFQQANHASNDLRAQAPDGPLAQIMGLFGAETPSLYHATPETNSGAPFICGAEGPLAIGVYQAADGAVQIVGLKQGFEFETLADGSTAALPFSPDQVCARLRFTQN